MLQLFLKLSVLFKQRTGLKADMIAVLVALGVSVRVFHFCHNYTIWYDEAVLLFNILDKGFMQLLGPLDYEVAAPPLFLWMLKVQNLTTHDNAYVWRFFPFLASCLTLVLTAGLAQRTLTPLAAKIVTALVAFSDAHLWLGCCIKPYVFDACLTTGFLYVYSLTAAWPLSRRLTLFAAVAPLMICFSYPMLFMYGCLIAASLPMAWRQPGRSPKVAWAALGAIVLATFVLLYTGPIRAQRVPGLVAGWKSQFANWERPWFVPLWSIGNTFTVFHWLYNPSGGLCLILSIVGARVCWQRRQLDWLVLLAGPIFLAYIAALKHSYPYGNNRLMLFAAPGIGVLVGLGIPPTLEWLRARRAWAPAALIFALVVPVAVFSSIHMIIPYNQPDSSGTAAAVRAERQPGDLVGSDEGTYSYFFYHDVKPLAVIRDSDVAPGTRLWAVMDHYYPDQRHDYVCSFISDAQWDLIREEIRNRSSLFLFVKK